MITELIGVGTGEIRELETETFKGEPCRFAHVVFKGKEIRLDFKRKPDVFASLKEGGEVDVRVRQSSGVTRDGKAWERFELIDARPAAEDSAPATARRAA